MYGVHLNKPRHFSCLHHLAGRKPGEIPPVSPLLTFQTIVPPAQAVSLCGGAGRASHTALPRVLIPPGLHLLRAVTSISPRHPSRAHSPRILLLNLLVKLGGSLWSAQRSFRSSGGSPCLQGIALPFSSSDPRPRSVCDPGPLLRPLLETLRGFPRFLCHLTHR